ncbi:ShlB/FhaC/HecB family hemolysin secretion/activation protein [Stutzerimonas nitrititolerans]|uniref:ShlB/FhaC/HecB family hemolysin secretion/activation protein n=1 Tax=Stutzerimonas nitrititolerans TaxID=2482751 RepID=UPI00289CC1DA|nr:ShlB/FhaC/HecB family hemolysin secretion/activation protein [Stutzerimonas nitrititolerans]
MKLLTPSSWSIAIAFTALASAPAHAQDVPGAGLIYQQSQQPTLAPLEPSVDLKLEGAPLASGAQGGAKVSVQAITLKGNSVFSNDELLGQLGDIQGREYNLAGLQELANRISLFYRAQGYPFARALLPAQDLADGELVIQVVEGRYGQVATSGEAAIAAVALPYVAELVRGEPIESDKLEQSLLILGDLPGVAAIPVMRPGTAVGTGDLDVQMSSTDRVSGRLSVDNHGSRFSGAYRGRADMQANRVLMVGDELSVSALYSSEDTWLGGLSYSIPLAVNGLRGFVGYSHTDYTLGKGFEGYTGTAKVSSLGISYPWLRSQLSNVRLQATYQYKDLDDNADFANYTKATQSHSLPVALLFDHRDSWGGGGVSWGSLTLTPGKLEIDQTAAGEVDYDFFKVNLDLARLQALAPDLTLYGRVSGQWSDRKYLDGSESFYLGGPSGVRAFPVGEGSDSRGWLAQLELRYALDNGLSPYLLVDGGSTPNGGIDDGEGRSVSGAGFGVRYNHGGWSADLVSAWKLDGGESQSDGRQKDPRFWFNLAYSF